MFLHITSVTYLADYRLQVQFNDGTVKEVDLRDELYGEVFEPLKNLDLFKQIRLNPESHTIEWPNGADFAPEYCMKSAKKCGRLLSPAPVLPPPSARATASGNSGPPTGTSAASRP